MKKSLIAVAVASTVLGISQASAQDLGSFRLQFGAATASPEGPAIHQHRSDFQHYDDYYILPGYGDPYRHTSCQETSARDEDGRPIRRITCFGRNGPTSDPAR